MPFPHSKCPNAKSPADCYEAIDTALYQLEQLFFLLRDITLTAGPNKNLGEVMSESAGVTFGHCAEHTQRARRLLTQLHPSQGAASE